MLLELWELFRTSASIKITLPELEPHYVVGKYLGGGGVAVWAAPVESSSMRVWVFMGADMMNAEKLEAGYRLLTESGELAVVEFVTDKGEVACP